MKKRASTGLLLLKIALFLFVTATGAYSVLVFVAGRENVKISVGWDEEFGTLESRLERYPPRGANRQALEMQRLSEPLGIALEPREAFGSHPTVDDPAFHDIRDGIDTYILEQLSRGDGPIDPPPAPIADYLVARAALLEAVRSFLLANDTPYWARDLERVFSGPFFNPKGHVDLHLVLIADALTAIATGDQERALGDVEASWRFLDALRDNVYVETLGMAFRITQRQLAVVRLLEEPGEVWYDRFDPASLRVPALDALKHYGWVFSHVDETIRWDAEMHPMRKVMAIAAKPYVQLCEIDTIADYRPNLAKLIELKYLCDRDLEASGVRLDWRVPWWNQIGDHLSNSVRSFVDIWRQLEFDYEATRKWLITAGHVDPRPQAGGLEASRVCPADRWIYNENGGGELTFSREPNWPSTKAARSPTLALGHRFRLQD